MSTEESDDAKGLGVNIEEGSQRTTGGVAETKDFEQVTATRPDVKGGINEGDHLYAGAERICAGCMPHLAMKLIAKACGPDTVAVTATGCMYVAATSYNNSPWAVPWVHSNLGNPGSYAAGIADAYKQLMQKDKYEGEWHDEKVNVVAIGGDGGTADFGLSHAVGAMNRETDMLYVMYDNECWANTNIQATQSSSYGARTTTSPKGTETFKKDMPMALATGLTSSDPYIATASVSHPEDYISKMRKGLAHDKTAFISVLAPCTKGWDIPESKAVELSRLSVDAGIFPLWEFEDHEFSFTYQPEERIPVRDFYKMQGRFEHVTEEELEMVQKKIDKKANFLGYPDRADT